MTPPSGQRSAEAADRGSDRRDAGLVNCGGPPGGRTRNPRI